jgi:hypothetical protein
MDKLRVKTVPVFVVFPSSCSTCCKVRHHFPSFSIQMLLTCSTNLGWLVKDPVDKWLENHQQTMTFLLVDYQRLTMLVKWQINRVISGLALLINSFVFFSSDITCLLSGTGH